MHGDIQTAPFAFMALVNGVLQITDVRERVVTEMLEVWGGIRELSRPP